jgi:hypothetical protein
VDNLAKDPEERWQSPRDLSAKLKGILEAGLVENPKSSLIARSRPLSILVAAMIVWSKNLKAVSNLRP